MEKQASNIASDKSLLVLAPLQLNRSVAISWLGPDLPPAETALHSNVYPARHKVILDADYIGCTYGPWHELQGIWAPPVCTLCRTVPMLSLIHI